MTAPTLAKAGANPAPFAGRRDSRVWAQIGHEVEQHEAGEDRQGLRPVHEVGGKSGEKQACGTAEEAENLQRNSAQNVCEQYRKDDPDNQQCGISAAPLAFAIRSATLRA
jgi:hypothetical protein